MPILDPEERRAYDRERKRRVRADQKTQRDSETLDDIRTLLKVIVDQNNIILNHIVNGSGKTENVLPKQVGRTEVGQKDVLPESDFSYPNPPESKLNGTGSDMGRTESRTEVGQKVSDFGLDKEKSYPSLARANKEDFISSSNSLDISTTSNVVDEDKKRVIDRARGAIVDVKSADASENGSTHRIQGKCPWEEIVGAAYISQVAQKMAPIHVDMGSTGWVRKLLRHGYEQTGGVELSKEQIVLAVQRLFRALEENRDKVKSPSGWARSTFVNIVQELVED